jgi:hypothetical protein
LAPRTGPRRADVLLGALTLAGIVTLAIVSTRLDGPIRAKGLLLGVLAREAAESGGSAAAGDRLPLGEIPCIGSLLRGAASHPDPALRGSRILLCRDDPGDGLDGALALRVDRRVPYPARPILRVRGEIFIGGPRAPEQGLLLYRDGAGALRLLSSHRRAKSVAREAERDWLFFGHLRWEPGALARERAAAAWSADDGAPWDG